MAEAVHDPMPEGGWYGGARPRERLLRRLLLALHAPPSLLTAAGRLIPASRRTRWLAFVSGLETWRELRRRSTRDEWRRVTRGVPVLLYHGFGDAPGRYVVSRRSLARQLRLLSLLRFRVLSYSELVRAIAEQRLPPRRTVVLTIDDGYAECVDASELLARHGYGATVFVVSGRLGAKSDWLSDEGFTGRPLLSAGELRELRARGVEIGAHTRTHSSLPDLDVSAIREEVAGSRDELERVLGEPVRSFAYPYGSFDDRVVDAVRLAGFESACTVAPQPAQVDDDPLLVPRILIERSDSLFRFLLKAGAGLA